MTAEFAENPYKTPEADPLPPSEPQGDFRVEGKHLLVRTGARLPDRCIKTNAPAADCKRKTKTLYWVHPAVYLSLLANILILLILYLCLRKKCVLEFSLSREAGKKHFIRNLVTVGILFAGFALVFTGIGTEQGALTLLGGVLIIVSLLIALTVGNLVRPTKHKDGWFHIPGCGKEFLDSIQTPPSLPATPNS